MEQVPSNIMLEDRLQVQSGIIRLRKPINLEIAKELLLHEHHYKKLESKVNKQDNLFAYLIVQLPTGYTYVAGIGKSSEDIFTGELYDVIGDNSHNIVQSWIPEIEKIIGENMQLKAAWNDGSEKRYG